MFMLAAPGGGSSSSNHNHQQEEETPEHDNIVMGVVDQEEVIAQDPPQNSSLQEDDLVSEAESRDSTNMSLRVQNDDAGTTSSKTNNGTKHVDDEENHMEVRHLSHDDDNEDGAVMHSLPHPEELQRAEVKRSGKLLQNIAGVAGNILEWYDFAVFGFLGDIIGQNFFPPQEGHANLIESFTVFGSAFLMRPIGGLLMGYIGDTYGRKRALEISIFLMAFPTFTMGCLPTYDQIGYWSTIFLILTRLIQGMSVGGQLVSSLVYTVENNPKEKWGLYGSFVMAAANFGTLLGGLFAYGLQKSLSEEELLDWGWRIPFLSGIVLSLSGVYLKFYCEDDVMEHSNQTVQNPIVTAFKRENLRSLLTASLVPMLWAGGVYTTFVWMSIYMKIFVKVPVDQAFGVNAIALFTSICILFPVAGIFSDLYGRTKVMFTGGIGLIVLSPIMVIVISKGDAVASFFAQASMGVCLSLWGAPMCAWLVESFPSHVRLTSVAVGYNLAQAFAGGTSPAMATYITERYGLHAPGFWISALAAISVTGLCLAPREHMDSSSSRAHEALRDFTIDDDDEEEEDDKVLDYETELI